MTEFYLNKNTGEVHKITCNHCNVAEFHYLGMFRYCSDAVREALKITRMADGCYYCCNGSHKR